MNTLSTDAFTQEERTLWAAIVVELESLRDSMGINLESFEAALESSGNAEELYPIYKTSELQWLLIQHICDIAKTITGNPPEYVREAFQIMAAKQKNNTLL